MMFSAREVGGIALITSATMLVAKTADWGLRKLGNWASKENAKLPTADVVATVRPTAANEQDNQ